ncbi:MAG: type IV toxin-antitoxin system AbiEi family antitoxin domain-containing protein, partial [Solirubrobacterales bacterium]|nr:type IV toxin-antitoxin system AbiEi family antitoxin domain-containing protein [Solirubrobacterales bacterium]
MSCTRHEPIDLAIARVARSTNRVITWRQLVELGVSRRAAAHRVRRGRLFRWHRGVYLLDPPERAERITLFTAAVAACGEGAFLSHRSAAELWGLTDRGGGEVHVTAVGRNPGAREGIRRHRAAAVDDRDVRTVRGILVSSAARML